MINMNDLLLLMSQKKASDLHLTVGSPPVLRVDGVVLKTNLEKLTPETSQRLVYSLLNDAQKQRFERDNELDIAHLHLEGFCETAKDSESSFC